MYKYKSSYRAIIAELHDSPTIWWVLYYSSLFLFSLLVFWPEPPGPLRHLFAGVVLFAAISLGIVAFILSLSLDYFLGKDSASGVRISAGFLGAATCALGYGALETHYRIGGVGAPIGFALTSAKALASFVSAVGFAGVIAAFTAELTSWQKVIFNTEPVEYTVQYEALEHTKEKLTKRLILLGLDGKLSTFSINMSLRAGVLQESIALAAQVKQGDRVKLIEYRKYAFIVGVIRKAKINPV